MGMKSEVARQRWPEAAFWVGLAASVLALKVVGLALDPQPQFFMGDSASYVHTALTGWVPPDRSYLYGVLLRVLVADTQSLAPLVIVQAMASAASALLAAWWARLVFSPGRVVLCAVAWACALDPTQLLYERYAMTEAFALLALASTIVALTHVIVRGQWLWMAPAALAGATVIALRMSLLPVVLACLTTAPFLALLARALSPRRTLLCLGVTVLFVPLALAMASRLETGAFLLAAWSPLLMSRDFPDPAQGERILEGIDLASPDLFAREVNLWHPSGFMHRLKQEVTDPLVRHRLARETAVRVLTRDPGGVVFLGWTTYARLWNTGDRRRLMRWDVGDNPLGAGFRDVLAAKFRLVADDRPRPTLTSRYYLGAGAWFAAGSLLAPLLLAVSAWRRPAKQVASLALLVVASGAILGVVALLTTLPVVRYLHPIGWMLSACFIPALFGGRAPPPDRADTASAAAAAR
jgi:hypothetical protein